MNDFVVEQCTREQPHDGPCNGLPCDHRWGEIVNELGAEESARMRTRVLGVPILVPHLQPTNQTRTPGQPVLEKAVPMLRGIVGSIIIFVTVVLLPLAMFACYLHRVHAAEWMLTAAIVSFVAWTIYCIEPSLPAQVGPPPEAKFAVYVTAIALGWLGIKLSTLGVLMVEWGQTMGSLYPPSSSVVPVPAPAPSEGLSAKPS